MTLFLSERELPQQIVQNHVGDIFMDQTFTMLFYFNLMASFELFFSETLLMTRGVISHTLSSL